MSSAILWWVAPGGSILALITAWVFYVKMKRAEQGTDKMIEIAGYVHEGAMAYLTRQYKVVGIRQVVAWVDERLAYRIFVSHCGNGGHLGDQLVRCEPPVF